MYLLAILLPPLAVWIRKGFLAALFNLVLSLLGFIPGVIYALIVVASTDADKRTEKLEKKLGKLIELHETKDNKKAEKTIETPVKKGIDWSKIFTLTNFAWLFTFGLFAKTFESLLDGEFLKSILFIATAAMIAPPTWKALREKSDKMTRNVAVVVTVVLVLLTSASYEAKTTNKTKSPASLPSAQIQERPEAPIIPSNPLVSPKPAVTLTPTESATEKIKTVVRKELNGKNNLGIQRLRNVYVRELKTGLSVDIEFNADDNLTANLRKKGMERQMSQLYRAVYTSGESDIAEVGATAYFPTIDSYGNEKVTMVYSTVLDASEAKMVNWSYDRATLELDIIPSNWEVIVLHPVIDE